MLIIDFSDPLHYFLFILQTSLPLLTGLFRSLNKQKKKLKKMLQCQHTHRANNLTLQEFKASARIVQGMHASKPVGQDAFWLPCHTAATTRGFSTTPWFPY